MGKHSDVIDIQQGGEHGRTALHLAAIYDHEECARILVGQCLKRLIFIAFIWLIIQITEFAANPKISCNLGNFFHEQL